LRAFVLGTGSSGNCLVFDEAGERLVIDAGMGPTRAAERMRALGADFVTARSAQGVIVTHDHGDHAAHALPIARALRAPIFAHDGVAIDRARRRTEVRSFAPGRTVVAGPFVVDTVRVPHDAPQVAVRVSAGGYAIGLVSDLGRSTPELCHLLADCDLVFLEANYCPRLLESGPYPERLKRRVAGPLGHLANEQAAEIASSLEDTRVSRLILIHLSRTNNTPARAREVVASRLRRLPVEALAQGESRAFDLTSSPAWPGKRARQLAFAFR
jgi:phosphoribosyl 1,2-cyclic phosphodiesterase